MDKPWENEPAHVEFRHCGLPCLLHRGPLGAWCGYVAVPPGHPLHGCSYSTPDISVHGGLTYADECAGAICHVPDPGEPDNVWWFGFDCAHGGDIVPKFVDLETIPETSRMFFQEGVYRDMAYVTRETRELAEQLAAVRG